MSSAATSDSDNTEVVLTDAFWDDLAEIDRAFGSAAPEKASAEGTEAPQEPKGFRLLVEDLEAVAATVFVQY